MLSVLAWSAVAAAAPEAVHAQGDEHEERSDHGHHDEDHEGRLAEPREELTSSTPSEAFLGIFAVSPIFKAAPGFLDRENYFFPSVKSAPQNSHPYDRHTVNGLPTMDPNNE